MSETVRLTIDGRAIEVPAGSTVLEAAERLGIRIPTLCYLKGTTPLNACFVCIVAIEGQEEMRPACSTVVAEGMVVRSDADDVRDARRTGLELLLSEHYGDCEGPCTLACPADLDIPTMIDQITDGNATAAVTTARKRILFNAVLGRICPRFCERACRRAQLDEAVAIADLQRYVGDAGLDVTPEPAASSGTRVAIFGAGPAGLTAAYYLLLAGHACTIFDGKAEPGGRLRELPQSQLPPVVLDAEIDVVRRLGAEFRLETRLGPDTDLWKRCRSDFDAVLLATGAPLDDGSGAADIRTGRRADVDLAAQLGLEVTAKGITVDAKTGRTHLEDVFAAGECVGGPNAAVHAVKSGRVAAVAIDQFLAGRDVTGEAKPINVRMGRLDDDELAIVRETAEGAERTTMPTPDREVSTEQARAESLRCVRCACLAKHDCRLRDFATEYDASPARYRGGEHRKYTVERSHPDVVYESNKCILCGLCIRAAREAHEKLGLAFHGRGFATMVNVPFEQQLVEGLKHAADRCVAACPTGALAFRSGHAPSNEG